MLTEKLFDFFCLVFHFKFNELHLKQRSIIYTHNVKKKKNNVFITQLIRPLLSLLFKDFPLSFIYGWVFFTEYY